MDAVKTIQKGHLTGYVYESAEAMGQAAADYMEKEIIELLKQKEEVTLLLSAGISQHTFHTALAKKKSFDWGRVNLTDFPRGIRFFAQRASKGISMKRAPTIKNFLLLRAMRKIRTQNADVLNRC